jgi:hypothetical protein
MYCLEMIFNIFDEECNFQAQLLVNAKLCPTENEFGMLSTSSSSGSILVQAKTELE